MSGLGNLRVYWPGPQSLELRAESCTFSYEMTTLPSYGVIQCYNFNGRTECHQRVSFMDITISAVDADEITAVSGPGTSMNRLQPEHFLDGRKFIDMSVKAIAWVPTAVMR